MSAQIPDGGPAYPVPGLHQIAEFNGMSMRDFFAAHAIQGMLAADQQEARSSAQIAKWAYVQADEMLAERSK